MGAAGDGDEGDFAFGLAVDEGALVVAFDEKVDAGDGADAVVEDASDLEVIAVGAGELGGEVDGGGGGC